MNDEYEYPDESQADSPGEPHGLGSEALLRSKGENCPRTVHLIRFALGELSPDSEMSKAISEHVKSCDYCRPTLEGLLRASQRAGSDEVRSEDEQGLPLGDSAMGLFAELSGSGAQPDESKSEPKRRHRGPVHVDRRTFLTALAVGVVGAGSVTYATVKELELQRLRESIKRSGLANAIQIAEPAIGVSGRDTLAIQGSVDPRYIAKVTLRVKEQSHELYKNERPADEDAHRTFSKMIQVPLDGEHFTATIEFQPFDEIRNDKEFAPFFSLERMRRTREFLATSYGLVADPKKEDLDRVAELETIESWADNENPNRYVVGGRIYRTKGARYGWLIVNPVFGGNMFVSSELSIDEGQNPLFRTRCFLGPGRVDHELYELFVVLADRPALLTPLQQIEKEKGYDWKAHGLVKSQARFKKNDGKDGKNGFDAGPAAPR